MRAVQPMVDESPIDGKERERTALLEEASRIVASVSAQGRELTRAEDAEVLSRMRRVRAIEKELHHHNRRHRADSE